MGYPTDLLATRAVVKPGLWAVIPKEGLVNNVIPNIVGCKVSIVASPKMGASFVQYIIEASRGGGTTEDFAGEENIETFLYVVSGSIKVKAEDKLYQFTDGGYLYAPAGVGINFEVESEHAKLLLYKQIYISYKELKPYLVAGNINEVEYRSYDGMANVRIKDFLPIDNLAFDMNMHILSFEPGGCHPFVETHVQEHGAYILSGQGMYWMDDKWMGIKKDDFMWFGPYCPQCAYGVGTEAFTYIYSKDCNRDVDL
ncbi:MAG: (S)-ureidoglycine aminohydrolase [Herbinix sp.]|jgi:(S)-ureidoglycine aminohydrolase|nr:(S)-ureidoglycine aminohydrolase [Herbinix sp.]